MSESRNENFEYGKSDKYDFAPGASEPHYKDSEFSPCPDCGALGFAGTDSLKRNAEGKWGVPAFFHRVKKGENMWGFETGHKK